MFTHHHFITGRQRVRGYRAPLTLTSANWVQTMQDLLDQIDSLEGAWSWLTTVDGATCAAAFWGEPAICGQVGSVTTTATLTVIYDANGVWLGSELTDGQVCFAGLASSYTVISSMASWFAIPTTTVSGLTVGQHYWIERFTPWLAEVQAHRAQASWS